MSEKFNTIIPIVEIILIAVVVVVGIVNIFIMLQFKPLLEQIGLEHLVSTIFTFWYLGGGT
jgi:amino acid transporter